ncbi:MerR family transcriptional regulator [Goodfellowiella coeruleoviolacea]|uniref:DNA-binding transcriptional regulator, MerR family n=1 Tax=Goodfellowiella coeruleoviolacea TaxID=334858 RepID=A0AAE3GIT8_9PSEU|nr:MerR family transcriptional regulator [Goodfellowiella coeruleoviolacea]MCP2168408.1 DNA-binding transcriptional regulator, MerR family [Goodfellowiella coeruleoviolacea]
MKIGELARTTGVSPRLLRYYEEQGLLVSHRVGTGHRRYAADAPTVVGHIRTLLAAGLPTSVIRGVLPCVTGAGPRLHECVVGVLRDQLRGVDERIGALRQTRAALADLLATAEQHHDTDQDVDQDTPDQRQTAPVVRSVA